MPRSDPPSAVIFGCAGTVLTEAEKAFYAETDPLGFILFTRNIESPEQVRALVTSLRETVGREAPVLIDQEGGRVQRLKPPHWRARPPMVEYGRLAARDLPLARQAARLGAHLIAAELRALGIDVDCAPLIDVPVDGADNIIGDRAFGRDPMLIADLGRAVMDGLLDGGVMPIVKHIPGHGRATVDSHEHCPVVETPEDELLARDLVPFQALADAPFAMTAHVVYTAWDAVRPGTLSPIVINEIIRDRIGFAGALISDDLSMKALGGDLADRAVGALSAGCDLALHCNGKLDEMTALAAAVGPLTDAGAARFSQALARRNTPEPVEAATLLAELDALLGAEGAA